MPRNGSSVYSLPAGNPVIPGTIIATTWANTTLTDIATALTNSLSTDGSTASVSLSGKTMAGGVFNGPAVTGILTLTGGQIAFPAVQVPSADANTLDDYEEGTWTPVLTFTTPGNLVVTYSSQVGSYTKVGRQVYLAFDVVTSTFTHTTASGDMRITGCPFTTAVTTTGPFYCSGLTFPGVVGSQYTSPVCHMTPGNTLIDFALGGLNTNTSTTLTTGTHTSGGNAGVFGSVVYSV